MLNALLWNVLWTAALAIVLAGLCRFPSMQKRPALRHWLWLLLLAKLITPPLISVPLLPSATGADDTLASPIPPSKPRGQHQLAADRPAPASASVESPPGIPTGPRALASDRHTRQAAAIDKTTVPVDFKGSSLRSIARVPISAGLFAISWLGTCVLLTVQGAHGVKLVRWLKRAGSEDAQLAKTCSTVASSLNIDGVVRSCVVRSRTAPLLWAWGRPLVVVPRQLVEELSPQQLRGIVAHELAHYWRRDHWANVFAFVVKVLLWWNPVVWWAARELRAAQELCCDAIAIDRCNTNRRSYATTLLRTLDFIQSEPSRPRALALGMGSRTSLLSRFEMIGETQLSYRLSRRTLPVLFMFAAPLVCIPVCDQGNGAVDAGVIETAPNPEEKPAKVSRVVRDAVLAVEDWWTQSPLINGAQSAPFQDAVLAIEAWWTRNPLINKVKSDAPERVRGQRPRGNCSIRGRVVSAATGEPVGGARMYLHYRTTHGSIYVRTASDGTFVIKDLPTGPFSLKSRRDGYQDAAYDPERRLGSFPQFSLEEGEHRSGIVLEVERAKRITGRIVDEHGSVPENVKTLTVLAWVKTDHGEKYTSTQAQVRADGSYVIDGLGNKPAYVMAINWPDAVKGHAYPPIYYPGTFSRNEATLIDFDGTPGVAGIDIRLRKEGGLILEGTVTDEAGSPVPEAFVVVHRPDMLFDFVTAYTDQQGRYRIQGLAPGEFLVHVDAVHRGFVRNRGPLQLGSSRTNQQDATLRREVTISGKVTSYTDQRGHYRIQGRARGEYLVHEDPVHGGSVRNRSSFDIDGGSRTIQQDITLRRGVAISGKFVDEHGDAWWIGESYGDAIVDNPQQTSVSSFSLTDFRNKHRPRGVQRVFGGSFLRGQGDYERAQMLFPTRTSFVIQGIMPGKTRIFFHPKKVHQQVLKILYRGRDILNCGITTTPGQEIDGVTIVVGMRQDQ